jgi:protein-S-isoprenylcysteine O-methyltransferase Ste14
MLAFKIAYWVGVIAQIAIRAPFSKAWQSGQKTTQRISLIEKVLLGLLMVGNLIIPLIFSVTGWLDFANYSLPAWMGWLGVFLFACGLFIFARSHIDLKSNWSPSLEIRKDHTLVTNGIYRYVRHPMYASQWVSALAQILLLQNWLAGPISLIVFIPSYLLRVRAEEKMMLDTFGDQYREYMKKVGGVIPKWPAHHN